MSEKNFENKNYVLNVKNLKTYFYTKLGILKAVDDVSFKIRPGEIMGLVGESGSGKSVTGFSILGLIDSPGEVVGGEIFFKNDNLLKYSSKNIRSLRGNKIAMIFQDPLMTLNPVLRIDTQMLEAIYSHNKGISKKVATKICIESLEKVGIPSAEQRMRSYPHEFSGGMRQRVCIAIALLNKPELIIADEPTTALDVTIQSQILYQMQELVKSSNTAMVWITHDLAVVSGLADSISVMYAGKIVEQGNLRDVIDKPGHPYTKGLISSIPSQNKRGKNIPQIPGLTPSLINRPFGCVFRTRCPNPCNNCKEGKIEMGLVEIDKDHWVDQCCINCI